MLNNSKWRVVLSAAVLLAVILSGCRSASPAGSSSKDAQSDGTAEVSSGDSELSEVSDMENSGDNPSVPGANSAKNSSVKPGSKSTASVSPNSKDDETPFVPDPPEIELGVKVNVLETVKLTSATNPSDAWNEATPVYNKVNGKMYATISTAWSYITEIAAGKSPLTSSDAFTGSAVMSVSREFSPPPGPSSNLKTPAQVNTHDNYWRRTYYGILDSVVVTGKDGKKYILAATHGENKNEIINGQKYKNNVKDLSTTYGDTEYSGYVDGIYQDNWENYFGFIGLCIVPLDNANWKNMQSFDKGPILWPAMGYLTADGQRTASHGLRHPSLFVDKDWIYLYYLDTGGGSLGFGRDVGVKVARAPLSTLGAPGSFKNYFYDNFEQPSLPSGYALNSRDALKKMGSKAANTVIGGNITRFSVAKLNGTKYYLGVYEEIQNDGKVCIKLTASTDLVNWGPASTVPGTTYGSWEAGRSHYTLMYNLALDDHNNVDASGFYLMGTQSGAKATYMKVSVSVTEKKA